MDTYPTKREVGKIIDSKSAFRNGICDSSQEGIDFVLFGHDVKYVNKFNKKNISFAKFMDSHQIRMLEFVKRTPPIARNQ